MRGSRHHLPESHKLGPAQELTCQLYNQGSVALDATPRSLARQPGQTSPRARLDPFHGPPVADAPTHQPQRGQADRHVTKLIASLSKLEGLDVQLLLALEQPDAVEACFSTSEETFPLPSGYH
jgi:hypothetical protein